MNNLVDLYAGSVFASMPTPNATEGWEVKSVMLRYRIQSAWSEFGFTGRILGLALVDGEQRVWTSDPLNYGMTTGYETIRLELPFPSTFLFGLNLVVNFGHDLWHETPPAWSNFYFASAGLEFVREV